MSKIMINPVSEQTIPIFQFIKEFPTMDKYLFVTTNQMEEKKKTSSILKSTKLNRDIIEKIIVNPESLKDVEQKLEDFKDNFLEDGDEIFINITTGTKLMAMALYKVFLNVENVKIFYIPIKTKVLKQIHPERKHNDKPLKYNINLFEFLTSYGIDIISKKKPLYNFQKSLQCFDLFINNKLQDCFQQLSEYRNASKNKKKKYKRDGIDISEINNFSQIADTLYPNQEKISYYDIEYLTGGWFEEFVYFKIKEKLELDDEFIGINYEIRRIYGEEVKNEFDVLFVKDNQPHIIECKTSNYDRKTKKNFLQETIYKLDSLKKEFGLTAKGYIFTLDENVKDSDIERAKLNNIVIVSKNSIVNEDYLLKMLMLTKIYSS